MNLSLKGIVAALGIAWIGCSAPATALVERIDRTLPRTFGYFVGDVVPQEIRVALPLQYTLEADRLPPPGRMDRWVWLREISVEEKTGQGLREYTVGISHQLLTAPKRPRTVTVPELKLYFTDGVESVPVIVEPLTVTVTPLLALVVDVGDFAPVQPAEAPPARGPGIHRWGLAMGAAILLGGIGLLWYLFGRIPFLRRSNGPFGRALRQIATGPAGDGEQLRALRSVHRAIDDTAGRVVLEKDLPQFVAKHQGFADLMPELQRFFVCSRRTFFETAGDRQGPEVDFRFLRELCRRGRDIERGLA